MRHPRGPAFAATLLSLVLAAGCAGSAGVEPASWAASVCTALKPWRADIDQLTGKVQTSMKPSTSPAQAQQQLVTMLAGAQDASETARGRVAAAGIPAVPDGATIAGRFVGSLRQAHDAYRHARTTVTGLNHADSAFYDRVRAAFDTLGKEFGAGQLDTGNVGSAPLQRSFDEAPECR
jgi:hypothetical protein